MRLKNLNLRLKIIHLISCLSLTPTLIFFPASIAFSQPACPDCPGYRKTPYGAYCPGKGKYGEKKPVRSKEEAVAILRSYFQDKGLVINIIRERRWGFIAEIRNADGSLLDIVVVDKRTGRIRSIY
ncbi:MAG: PepSY domain-containing protein [Thermodesulfovibrionales bacterium]|nr:PepSY domain-containing protein [Thermodesulfovibrionales bacterium]